MQLRPEFGTRKRVDTIVPQLRTTPSAPSTAQVLPFATDGNLLRPDLLQTRRCNQQLDTLAAP